jgi:hypothetical protein
MFGRQKRKITLDSIQRVRLDPGDVLVLRCDTHLSADECRAIKASAARAFPGHEAMLLTGGLRLDATVKSPVLEVDVLQPA